MSNTNDESHLDDERSPGFNRSIIGRIIAVTLFVGLGTFAVAQSVIGQKTNESDEVADLNDDNGEVKSPIQKTSFDSPAAQPPTSKSFNETEEPLKKSSLTPPSRATSFGEHKTTTDKSSPFPVRPINLPKQPLTTPASNGFQAQTTNSDTESAFANKLPPLNPVQRQVSGNVNTLKPPTIQNSFDASPNSNLPSAGAITNSLTSQFENARQKAENTTGAIRQNMGDAIDNAENSLRNLSDNVSGRAKSSFPGTPQDSGFASQNGNPSQKSSQQPSMPRNNSATPAPPSVAFDTSRDLKPIAGQASPEREQNRSAPRSLSESQPPNLTRPVQAFTPKVPTGQSINPRSSQRPLESSSNPGGSRFGSSTLPQTQTPNRTPVTQVAAAKTLMTKATPGDRQLEGMQSPSVTIEKIAPREIQVNQAADFQLIVKNVGRITASNVRVFDEIPVGSELIQATPQPDQTSGNKVDWNLGTLNPGQEKRIQLQLKPTRPGEIGSVAHVTFSAQASMRTRVTKPVLSVQHKSDPKVLIGDTVVLDITIKNEGDGPATSVMIQEDLPEQLEFTDGYRELEYTVGTLAPGQSKNVRLALKAAQVGAFRNVMVAHADGGLQAQHAIDIEVIAPELVVSSDGPNRRFLKRETRHQFSVRNDGTAKATNVELVCRLPDGLQYVSTNNRGKYDSSTHAVYWSLAELKPDMTASVELETLPIEPGNQGFTFEAVADLDQKAKSARELVVEHLVDVFFDIDDVVDPIEIGSETSYRVRVVNQGTKTANSVQLQVEFPNGIQPTTVDGNVTSEVRGQQVVFAPITSLNPGDEIGLTIHGKGVSPGDHRVTVNLNTDGRETNVSKQETTRVYSDR